MTTQKAHARRAAGANGDAPAAARVLQPSGWPMPKGYANGMAADGRIVVTGGVIGWDHEQRLADGFVAQVRQTLEQHCRDSRRGRGAARASRSADLVCRRHGRIPRELKRLGQIYREIFGAHYPAMALVQVVRLVEKAARVEIEATAVVPR